MMLKHISVTTNICKRILVTRKLTRNMSSEINDVIIESIKDKGVLTLNRPKALNALNLSMVQKITPALLKWEQDKSLVLIKGMGEKSFCAGGDVKKVAEAGLKGENLGKEFFKLEYSMNGVIGTYKIPYIAFIDGIVMGGGVGLSVHGQYRIATERTLFAMPETQIGLFPDVGGSYFLPRLGGKLGLYLGLTGHRLKGSDVLKAGVATHYVESKNLAAVEQDILKTCANEHDVDKVLCKYMVNALPDFTLAPNLNQIDRCFSADTVEGIIERLKADGSEWAQNTVKSIAKMSPTSLKVTKRLLDRGSSLSLLDCLQMEYNVAVNTMNQKDFYEGVRALLIDKDQKAKWNPATLEEVSNDLVEQHFVKAPKGLDQDLRNKL